uniref:Ribosomal protein S19 n=1 Tax=Pyramimonas parkeae TaxID=36894 RepID=A0A1S5R1T5_9CHLO|nr:ribosomal protein S19 [Pyramimonas parkeae]
MAKFKMTRSLQKLPYCSFKKLAPEKDKPIQTSSRSLFILPQFIGYTFLVHQGKTFTRFKVTSEMVGTKLGEYSFTRKPNIYKKKKKNGTKS